MESTSSRVLAFRGWSQGHIARPWRPIASSGSIRRPLMPQSSLSAGASLPSTAARVAPKARSAAGHCNDDALVSAQCSVLCIANEAPLAHAIRQRPDGIANTIV